MFGDLKKGQINKLQLYAFTIRSDHCHVGNHVETDFLINRAHRCPTSVIEWVPERMSNVARGRLSWNGLLLILFENQVLNLELHWHDITLLTTGLASGTSSVSVTLVYSCSSSSSRRRRHVQPCYRSCWHHDGLHRHRRRWEKLVDHDRHTHGALFARLQNVRRRTYKILERTKNAVQRPRFDQKQECIQLLINW